MAEKSQDSEKPQHHSWIFFLGTFAFLVLFSNVFAGSKDFLAAVGSHWASLMSGLVSVAITFHEKIRESLSRYVLYTVAAACIFFACFQAWQDEHEKAQNQATYMRLNPYAAGVPACDLPMFKTGAIPCVNIGYLNTGNFVAQNVTEMVGLESYDMSVPWDFGGSFPSSNDIENGLFEQMKKDWTSRNPNTNHKDYAPHDPPDFSSAMYTHPLSDQERQDFEQGKKMMFLLGFIKWTDAAGTHEWTLCGALSPHAVNPPMQAHNCYTHNNYLPKAVD